MSIKKYSEGLIFINIIVLYIFQFLGMFNIVCSDCGIIYIYSYDNYIICNSPEFLIEFIKCGVVVELIQTSFCGNVNNINFIVCANIQPNWICSSGEIELFVFFLEILKIHFLGR